MIIRDVRVEKRDITLTKPFKTALRTATTIASIDVILELENGITAKGSAAPTWAITGESAESIQAALQGPIKHTLLEHDIEQFQSLLRAIQTCCIGNSSAKAAADIALHDAFSQWLGVPLYTMLGGQQALSTSMTVGVDEPDKMAADAKQCVADGFSRLKIKVGDRPDMDIARIAAIQEAIPSHVALRLDANQGWKPKQAVHLINQIEQLNVKVEFIEQPVVASDFIGLKFVTDHVNMPVMADESLFSPHDALTLIDGRYVDLLNIKLMKCGGITNAWKIADMAETADIACMVGSMMESANSVTAAAHLAAAHPNVTYVDLDAPVWLSEAPEGLSYNGEQLALAVRTGVGE